MSAKKRPPFDFRKFLSDRHNYPDEMMLRIGDEGAEVSLADLRAYDSAHEGELGEELERQRKALEADQQKLQVASQKVAETWANLQQREAALQNPTRPPAVGTDPFAEYEADPVFRPIVTRMKANEDAQTKALADITAKMEQVVKSIGQMGTTYMGDKARQQFEAITHREDPVRPKDLNLDNLYKYAVEQRIYDRNNLPDLEAAYDRMTAPQRHKHELTEAEQRGRELALKEQAENAMLPRPSSPQGPAYEMPEGVEVPTSMADAFGKAAKDTDLWKSVNTGTLLGGGQVQ